MKWQILLPIFFLSTSYYNLVTDYSFVTPDSHVYVDTDYRQVGKAKFRTRSVHGSHEQYQDGHGSLFLSHYLTECNSLSWEAGYHYLHFGWLDNPRFSDSTYQFGNASLGWVSTSIKDWRWVLQTGVSVDTKTWNFGQSGVYYGLMWGRYQFSDTVGMHVGWTGYVGVQNGYMLPIIGVDWTVGNHWKCNGIFPVNLSIEYLFNKYVTASAEVGVFGMPYRFPMRVHGGKGRFHNGIFEVYSKGLELDLNFHVDKNFSATIGGGWNFGGWILIKDHANHHPKYYHFNGAPYAQARLAFGF